MLKEHLKELKDINSNLYQIRVLLICIWFMTLLTMCHSV